MATKDYALSVEAKSDYLFAYVRGIRTRETVIGITTEVFEATVAHRLSKVLVDVRALEGRLSILDNYIVVTELFEDLRGKGIRKAAIVDRPQSAMREWFLETLAVNRVFNLKIFTDVEEARQWLLVIVEE
jgi:hypothetical protein